MKDRKARSGARAQKPGALASQSSSVKEDSSVEQRRSHRSQPSPELSLLSEKERIAGRHQRVTSQAAKSDIASPSRGRATPRKRGVKTLDARRVPPSSVGQEEPLAPTKGSAIPVTPLPFGNDEATNEGRSTEEENNSVIHNTLALENASLPFSSLENGDVIIDNDEDLIIAAVVDETEVEEEIQRRVNETIKANTDLIVGATVVDEEGEKRKQRIVWASSALLLCIGVIALVVALTTRSDSNNSASSEVEMCPFCANEADAPDNLDRLWLSPTRTCQHLQLEMESSVPRFAQSCLEHQALAAWQCGCPDFPPLLQDDETVCRLCPDGYEAVAKDSSSGWSTDACQRYDSFLRLTVGNDTSTECVQQPACGCQLVINNNTLDCYESTYALNYDESILEDISEERSYTLCPETEYKMGYLEEGNEVRGLVNGGPPVALRSNAHVKCGKSGSSGENCVFHGGAAAVTLDAGRIQPGIFKTNIVIEGLTFRNLTTSQLATAVGIFAPTNVTFRDCVFQGSHGKPMIQVHNWMQGYTATHSNGDQVDSVFSYQSTVVFENCTFENFIAGPDSSGKGPPGSVPPGGGPAGLSPPGPRPPTDDAGRPPIGLNLSLEETMKHVHYNHLIEVRPPRYLLGPNPEIVRFTSLVLKDCTFSNNTAGRGDSPLILSSGGDGSSLVLEGNCFRNNQGQVLVMHTDDETYHLEGTGNSADPSNNPECHLKVNGTCVTFPDADGGYCFE